MRIWSKALLPHLCRNHLLAAWRESLGAYSIIINNKKGYSNHPAVKEFADCPEYLWIRLLSIRKEMLRRNYNPKKLPEFKYSGGEIVQWEDIDRQYDVLVGKRCDCILSLPPKYIIRLSDSIGTLWDYVFVIPMRFISYIFKKRKI